MITVWADSGFAFDGDLEEGVAAWALAFSDLEPGEERRVRTRDEAGQERWFAVRRAPRFGTLEVEPIEADPLSETEALRARVAELEAAVARADLASRALCDATGHDGLRELTQDEVCSVCGMRGDEDPEGVEPGRPLPIIDSSDERNHG